MEAGRDLVLFILFLVALGIAWFLTGGPSNALSHSGWFLSGPTGIPGVELATSSSYQSSSNTSSETEAPAPAPQKPSAWDYFFNYHAGTGETTRPADSPYARFVTLSSGSTSSKDPSTEYIRLNTNSSLKGTVVITGWTLESAQSGVRVTIGNAAMLPFLGGMNAEGAISLGPQSQVTIVSGRSPNGASFRLNKCTGYFNQFQKFTPSLPSSCPDPEDEMLNHPEIAAGNQNCQDFIRSMPSCHLTVTQIPGNVGGLCQDFILNTLSYNGCITEHQRDPDFYSSSWRIFLNRSQEMWGNTHDAIRLLDENGLLVDEITY